MGLDAQGPHQPQTRFGARGDPHHPGAALDLLVQPLEQVGGLEMFVVGPGQTVEGQGFADVLVHPVREFGVFRRPLDQPGGLGQDLGDSLFEAHMVVRDHEFDAAQVPFFQLQEEVPPARLAFAWGEIHRQQLPPSLLLDVPLGQRRNKRLVGDPSPFEFTVARWGTVYAGTVTRPSSGNAAMARRHPTGTQA